jgi:hypothetical protein
MINNTMNKIYIDIPCLLDSNIQYMRETKEKV